MEAPNPAQIIKESRKSRSWSIRRLGRESGLSAGYVSQMESGARPVTPRAMGYIADALGIPPHEMLSLGGFIPDGHLDEAKRMALLGMAVPSIHDRARGGTSTEKMDWLIVDYLYLLGDDPYGTGWTGGPGGNEADWTPLVPDAPTPLLIRMRSELDAAIAIEERKLISPIEGWNDLSDVDRAFIQQMVNKLRRPTTGE